MKSQTQHVFSQVPKVEIPRSVFNRSHGHKTTFDAGYLVPIYLDEALPGDTFNLKTTLFARLSTPIVPIMDNLYLDTFYFSVPYRLLWEHWQNFCGEREEPQISTEYFIPEVTTPEGGFAVGSLADYFGLPTSVNGMPNVNALPFRAYQLIYNEWFRDQNLITPLEVEKGDGPDDADQYVLQRRGKRHDYFTSALPWPQKGDAVELPLGSTAAVIGNGDMLGLADGVNATFGLANNTGAYYASPVGAIGSSVGAATVANNKGIGVTTNPAQSGLIADLSTATAATINSLREAFQLQRMLERDARGGTRYTEIIRSHFGVVSPDARLQRPEYLGGSSARININPVQQTSSTDNTTPQGHLAAYAQCADQNGGFNHSFTEHCLVIGLACVRADQTYQYGIPRMFSRQTRFDHYWPALAHLGEQEILKKEIYATGTAADEQVWGYQERYAEYRYKPSQITGKFRSSDPQSLDVWHLAQEWGGIPLLAQTFIEENPPVDRVIAVPSEPHIIFDSFFDLKCARPMPVYSVPGQIDHF